MGRKLLLRPPEKNHSVNLWPRFSFASSSSGCLWFQQGGLARLAHGSLETSFSAQQDHLCCFSPVWPNIVPQQSPSLLGKLLCLSMWRPFSSVFLPSIVPKLSVIFLLCGLSEDILEGLQNLSQHKKEKKGGKKNKPKTIIWPRGGFLSLMLTCTLDVLIPVIS